MSFLEKLNEWDTWLFLHINTQWSGPFLDAVLPLTRNKLFWIPLYVFLLWWMFQNFGWKAWKWLLFVIITITVSDQFSSHLIKPYFHRLRPCNEPELYGKMRFLLSSRPGNFSFTSSHAVNHFALGTFFYRTLKPYMGNVAYLFLAWAAIIGYAQVYVGVHYPGDVICGSVIGALIGWAISKLYAKFVSPLIPITVIKS